MASAASSSSASSSSTNMIPQKRYDVFLSFRGEDTRHNFTSHLHATLCAKKIEAFIDNQLRRGDEISQSLLDAIEASVVSVVIFSEDYASSPWCLDELVKILECKNKYGQTVIPVFYHVDPSNVRNQTGIFGDAFIKLIDHQQRFQEKIQRWRSALTDAGKISGYHSDGMRSESELVEEIADDILKKLNDTIPITSNSKNQLVGVDSSIKEIELLLSTTLKEVYTSGIWGIGGIGKTTIARAIFNNIFSHFEGCCFISDIREEEEKKNGLSHLQQELLSTLLGDENVKIGNLNIGLNFASKRLSRKKVLIVLDDVTHYEQIELLIGGLEFATGSRIIITTRDKHVLNIHRVDYIYKVKKLAHNNALKLFSPHAFGKNSPNVGYEELSHKIIKYADGVPLALKVLGRFLVGRTNKEWESAIKKLEKNPNMDIFKVLKISYDGLDYEEQNIFLDIACFFKGEDGDLVTNFLDACGFSGQIGLSVLVDKSLIIISNHNKIIMHDLLQEMGREIIRQESINNPRKRSRLWHHEDIYQVLTHNTGTEAIEGISFDMSKVQETCLNPRTFTKMRRLRFIRFYGENKCNISHFQGHVFAELRYLMWEGYRLKSLPSNINPKNLVSLKMPNNNIKQLWNGVQRLVNLKRVDLTACEQLVKIPDLSLAQNLESLDLKYCTSLIEIQSSIQLLQKLKYLSLSGCSNLKRLPEITSYNLERLFLSGTAIEELPSSIECLVRLFQLDLALCKSLHSLPSNLCKLKSLEVLSLYGCSNLQRLPDEIGSLEALRNLDATGTAIREVPSSTSCLNNLFYFTFKGIRDHEPMRILSSDGLHNLTFPVLVDSGIKQLPENLGHLSSLTGLYLDGNDFERIPQSIIQLYKLEWLSLKYCERLQSLPELPPSLRYLNAEHCTSLEALSGLSVLFTPNHLSQGSQQFYLGKCLKLDRDELNKIAKDFQQKIQFFYTTWLNEVQDGRKYYPNFRAEICYPGSEIPEWFSYQSKGSSITLKLPPGCFNNNHLGFALCATVAFCRGHENYPSYVDCMGKLKTKDGHWRVPFANDFYIGTIGNVESDHVVLGCYLRQCADDCEYFDNNEAFFQFDVSRSTGYHSESGEVKGCGIHFFYDQDFREVHELDREESPSKRLKYSTSPLQESACPW